MGQTIDLTPTWTEITNALIVILEAGTPAGKKLAKAEIKRMAELADNWVKYVESQPEQPAEKVWDVISPDGFSIDRCDYYLTEQAAREAFDVWSKRYQRQGYYSSSQHGRIELADLVGYCEFIQIDRPEPDEDDNEIIKPL